MLDTLLWLFLPWVYYGREVEWWKRRNAYLEARKEEQYQGWVKQYEARLALEEEKKTLLIDLDKARTDLANTTEASATLLQENRDRIDDLQNALVYGQYNLAALIVMHDNKVFIPMDVLQYATHPDLRVRVQAASDGVHLSTGFDEPILEESGQYED